VGNVTATVALSQVSNNLQVLATQCNTSGAKVQPQQLTPIISVQAGRERPRQVGKERGLECILGRKTDEDLPLKAAKKGWVQLPGAVGST
jgi:hypothetical protein